MWALAHDGDHERAAEVTYDLTSNQDGWVEVQATFFDLGRKELGFRELGVAPEYTYDSVVFSSDQGPIEATRKDNGVWMLSDVPEEGPIHVSWRFAPGGMGRHGHQGWLGPDWASFDGRSLLLPSGRKRLSRIRFRATMPDGWTLVHPYRSEGDWVVAEHRDALKPIVHASCFAAGPFRVESRKVGDTELRVGVPTSFEPAWQQQLVDTSIGEFEWFHDQLGYDRRGPFAITWLPAAADGGQVFGGASVNGACYEHPKKNGRAFLLLGHRIGHPMNKYVPSGLTIRDERDHWFMEGWASYIEVVAADGAGVLPDQRYWNTIYRRYIHTMNRKPELDVALAHEGADPASAEYLHYTKGPLVVKLLADLIQQRSGVTLEAFMKHVWSKYGFHQAAFSLREELKSFTGDDYDDFFAMFVDRPGVLYPSWPEVVDGTLQKRMNVPPAATIGDVGVHPEYLFWLAWSGVFERYADIVDFLERSAHARQVLEQSGTQIVDPTVGRFHYALPSMSQYALDRTTIDWPVEALPARGGCFGQTAAPARHTLKWTDAPAAKLFQRLLELEQAYEGSLGRTLSDIRIDAPVSWKRDGERLAIGPNEAFRVRAVWNTPPPRVRVEVRADGGQPAVERRTTLDPTWLRTSAKFAPNERPAGDVILLVGVGRDGGEPVFKPLWQAQASFTPKGQPDDDAEPPEEEPQEPL